MECFVIKDRVIKGRFMTKERVIMGYFSCSPKVDTKNDYLIIYIFKSTHIYQISFIFFCKSRQSLPYLQVFLYKSEHYSLFFSFPALFFRSVTNFGVSISLSLPKSVLSWKLPFIIPLPVIIWRIIADSITWSFLIVIIHVCVQGLPRTPLLNYMSQS